MARLLHEQIQELIKNSGEVLIATKSNPTPDSIASAVAMAEFVRASNKSVQIVCAAEVRAPWLPFITHGAALSSSIESISKLIVTINAPDVEFGALSYHRGSDGLKIYITPKRGSLDQHHAKVERSAFRFDLAVVVDSPDLESLGTLYSTHTDFFTHVPIINIDADVANDRFGTINVVDPSAAATSEVVYSLFEKNSTSLSSDAATSLLAGIYDNTGRLKGHRMRAETLKVVGDLVARGADREAVMNTLYRSKRVAALKLWGRAFARVKLSPPVISSALSREDFFHAEAEESDVYGLSNELLDANSAAKVAILFYEAPHEPSTTIAEVRVAEGFDALSLFSSWRVQGDTRHVRVTLPGKTIVAAQKEILENLKTIV